MAEKNGIIPVALNVPYSAKADRYENMQFRHVGKSGVQLSVFSLGYWNNFGSNSPYSNCKEMTLTAFDLGINQFDLANGYGPPFGAAEETFGRIYKENLRPYRDEIFVATKAGFPVHASVLGCGGSRKALIGGLDQSLKRLGLDYVDLFYYHKHDTDTPLEETAGALADIVRSGKALYVGVSNMDAPAVQEISDLLWENYRIHLFMHQPCYNMLQRAPEQNGLFETLEKNGIGCIPYVALAQGLLSGKYNKGIPAGSRAATPGSFLPPERIAKTDVEKVIELGPIAERRGQSMAQMALAWILRLPVISTVLIGASRPQQIVENVKALENLSFTAEELAEIDAILNA